MDDGIAAGGIEVTAKTMEVAVMSLSMREQQALDGIESRLAGAAPELAALLVTFCRLTSGEAMPAREEVRVPARSTHHVLRRICRLLAAYAGLDGAMALLWVLITVAMIAAAVALSTGGSSDRSGGACVSSWPVACAASAAADPFRPMLSSTTRAATSL